MTMSKKTGDYKAYVADMDGTLYFQRPVRLAMLKELMFHYLFHPLQIKELLALKEFRQIREKRLFAGEGDFYDKQISFLSDKYNMDPGKMKNMIYRWMEEVPLKYIRKYRNNRLIDFLNEQMEKGSGVVVYSDYPVEAKLDALSFRPDRFFYASDPEIGCMKPDEKGLRYIISLLGKAKEDILFIGDRMEKDGECARRCGIDFLFLKKGRFVQRNK